MNRGQLARTASITVLVISAAAVHWPAPQVDVSPLFEQHGRPSRPPHPASVYTPGGHR